MTKKFFLRDKRFTLFLGFISGFILTKKPQYSIMMTLKWWTAVYWGLFAHDFERK
jgi:hypothetical protein